MAKHIYGIIQTNGESDLGVTGLDRSPVHIVANEGLGCVLSDYSGKDFNAMSQEELVRALLTHQQVVEYVMPNHTVLPVKFGTLLPGTEEAQALLAQEHSEFLTALSYFQNKVEIEVAATWDTNQVLREISNEDDVVRLRVAVCSKGPPTVEDQVHLGRMVKACLDRRRDNYREHMMSFIRPLAINLTTNTLVSDEMVMNVAFLVDQARLEQFYGGIQQIDRLLQNRITFRVIGPLPPYSFSTVEIRAITTGQVAEARQALHLGDIVSEAEVKRAYRRLAALAQQDLRPGDKTAQASFARLREASELLLRYCRVHNKAWKNQWCQPQAIHGFQYLFSIAIKGSETDEIEPARFGGAVRVSVD